MKTITLFFSLLTLSSFLLLSTGCERETLEISLREEHIDVGSYQLYTRTLGSAGPTTVLITGLAGTTNDWRGLESELADLAVTINYDREGLGRSLWQKRPKDSYTIAAELRALMQAKQLPPPYILVAHSLGGIHARAFAERYGAEVAGLVLVDPTPEDLIDSLIATFPVTEQPVVREALEREQAELLANLPEGAIKEEVKAIPTLYAQARSFDFTLDVPVAVISSMKSEVPDDALSKQIAKQLRDRLLDQIATGPNRHILTTKSGHFIQNEEPQLVREAIEWVIAEG